MKREYRRAWILLVIIFVLGLSLQYCNGGAGENAKGRQDDVTDDQDVTDDDDDDDDDDDSTPDDDDDDNDDDDTSPPDDDDNDDNDDNDDSTPVDDDDDDDTPDVPGTHQNYFNCYACHTEVHDLLYLPPAECYDCHTQGYEWNDPQGPQPPGDHGATSNCLWEGCHEWVHSAKYQFNDYCKVCHQFPDK